MPDKGRRVGMNGDGSGDASRVYRIWTDRGIVMQVESSGDRLEAEAAILPVPGWHIDAAISVPYLQRRQQCTVPIQHETGSLCVVSRSQRSAHAAELDVKVGLRQGWMG